MTINKIAIDIRLGARSGRPIYQEPFGKKQKGSSAMPHKKNTISTEKEKGMAGMAKGFFQMIQDNIETWEERAIEQSSVERVAWPDLFHAAIHSAKTMIAVLSGLVVYPDNMLLEIIDSRGCYAAGEAKEFLRHYGASLGLTTEDAYRIVQLAAFNAFEPEAWQKALRENLPDSFKKTDAIFFESRNRKSSGNNISIENIIPERNLRVSPQLDASDTDIERWHTLLEKIFTLENWNKWNELFLPSNLLKGEEILYKEILGE